jgi:CRP/FNR family cyclic AMP-dependent transcriptional regulator
MESETTDLIASLAVRSPFIGLTDGQLARLADAGCIEHFEAGQLIVSERQPGQALYTILSGSVCVHATGSQASRHEQPAKHGAESAAGTPYDGDFFGETSILDFEPTHTTVAAREPCDLLVIPVPRLYDVFQEDRDIHIIVISNIARMLSRRLKLAGERCHEPGLCRCAGPEACGSRPT